MAIIRSKKQNNYTVIDNKVFDDNCLTLEAQGLLCKVLSKPDNWQISVKNLVKSTENTRKQSGEKVIYAILNELIEKGFVVRKKNQNGSVDYTVYDTPQIPQTAEIANRENGKQPNPQTAEIANSRKGDNNKYGINITNTENLITRLDGTKTDFSDLPENENPKTLPSEKSTKPNAKTLLAEFGITDQLADDYIAHRKAKRASISKTVLQNLAAEAAKANMTVAQAIEYQIAQGWQGFSAEWILNKMGLTAEKSSGKSSVNHVAKHTNGGFQSWN